MFGDFYLGGISSWGDVAHLGRNNIGYLIRAARQTEGALTKEVGNLKERIKLFQDKDGSSFTELAKGFENPNTTERGNRPGSWSGDFEPLGTAAETRKHGASTYNICGWCKYASGSHRYSYCISGSCQLLTEVREGADKAYGEKEEGKAPYYHHEVKFDTPCKLQLLTAKQCNGVVNGIGFKIGVLLARREVVREAIRKLIQLKKASPENKPWLMNFQPAEYMNVGDELAVYLGGFKNKTATKDWAEAIGVFGYRHHDGCMSYMTLYPIHDNKSYFEGRGGGAGMSRPEVLLRSEYDYLHGIAAKRRERFSDILNSEGNADADLTFLRVWFKAINKRLEGFNPADFFNALTQGEFVSQPADWKPPTDEIEVRTIKDAEKVLQCLDSSLFKSPDEVKSWAKMQLRQVHPDKLAGRSEEVKQYAARQTRAVYEARDLILRRKFHVC